MVSEGKFKHGVIGHEENESLRFKYESNSMPFWFEYHQNTGIKTISVYKCTDHVNMMSSNVSDKQITI